MKTAIVTTTINVPKALESYVENLAANGHKDVEFFVVGDLKSEPDTGRWLDALAGKSGYAIHWWDPDRQRKWLKDLPELDALIPWNSVQRRNLAYLLAAEAGAECIVTIDDDNWATPEHDYVGGHSVVGRREELPAVSSSTGWFNTSSLLETTPAKPLFHRGYPTCKRGIAERLDHGLAEGRVVVNAGMWLDTPDADAMCHLNSPVSVVGFRPGFEGRLAIAPGTNMVFNSQNTSFHRDTLPAMYLMPMGGCVGTLVVGRYDDIWMSIFFKVIADHLGDLVCAGNPLVRQIRNEHDLINDLLIEVPAMRITNTLTRTLGELRLTGSDYATCYSELVAQLREALPRDGYSEDEQTYLTGLLDGMDAWVRVCEGFTAGSAS